ncbi:hypothetical protein [Methanogenium cariaci]|uniref:hypothetical protein n=1 Tax=Methanogenium cariaci TaxID=2197 RepID=UPI0007826D85|nr:hypothetical protein [Methanogenium cariaci]
MNATRERREAPRNTVGDAAVGEDIPGRFVIREKKEHSVDIGGDHRTNHCEGGDEDGIPCEKQRDGNDKGMAE